MCRPALLNLVGSLLMVFLTVPTWAQGPPPGRGPQNRAMRGDMEVFHFLLDHKDEIRRQVKNQANGVQTLTESDNPKVAAQLQVHVKAMHARIKENRPIRLRDPLFAAIFSYTDKIHMTYENTSKGVRVIETSTDPFVVKLIQAHAAVVSLFVQNGYQEMPKNHAVPSR